MGIRTQDILTSALLSLSQSEDASLLMLPALLVNETYRHKITKNLTDQIGLKPFGSI
jgi:hypothetical protein